MSWLQRRYTAVGQQLRRQRRHSVCSVPRRQRHGGIYGRRVFRTDGGCACMIPIRQTRTGEIGNCFAACLASILEIPLQVVPEFPTGSDEQFFEAAQKWLATKGLRYRQVPIKNGYRPR